MEQFKHLANLVVEDKQEEKEKKQRTSKIKEVAQLEGGVIRLYATGEVYPSSDLASGLQLEYGQKEETTYGLDVVDSTEWKPLMSLPRTILVGQIAKSEPKVDLFAQTRYNEDGTPNASVMTQGTKSQLLLNIARSMGWLTEDKKYVDLKVNFEYPVKAADNIAYIPKQVERGKTKGEKTYERRENVIFYPISVVEQTETTVNVEETTPTQNEVSTTKQLTNA